MIIRVHKTGRDGAGLMRYLYGAGKANEHVDQHLVAGSGELAAEWAGNLTTRDAAHLGRVFEGSWRESHIEQVALVGSVNGRAGVARERTAVASDAAVGNAHVFHVSLSLAPDDAGLSDEQWQTLAEDYVQRMGFIDEQGSGCDWVAVRHGLSTGGNDHIHVAVNLLRRDGHWASENQSQNRSQVARRAMEAQHAFLRPLRENEQQQTLSAYSPGERRRAEQRQGMGTGPVEPERVMLQRTVRAAALCSATEREWLTRLQGVDGVQVRPRWEAGGQENATGYSVRLASGQDTVWIGGKKLAPDLGLGQLRAGWAPRETPDSRADAVSIWRGEKSMHLPVKDPAELVAKAAVHLERWNAQLGTLDPTDRVAWRREMATAAGATAVLSTGARTDATRARWGGTSDALARTAQDDRGQVAAPLSGLSDGELAARHLNLALRAASMDRSRGWAAVMQQMSRTVRAVHAAHEAQHAVQAARQLSAAAGPLMSPQAAQTGAQRTAQIFREQQFGAGVAEPPRAGEGPVAKPYRPGTDQAPDQTRER